MPAYARPTSGPSQTSRSSPSSRKTISGRAPRMTFCRKGTGPGIALCSARPGATGSPARFYVDEGRALIDFALSLPKYMAGMPPVAATSVIRDFFLRRCITFMAIVVPQEYLYHQMFWMMKHTVVDCLEPPGVHIQAINARKPRYLSTYPSTIRNICIVAREKGITMHRPDVILVAGEVVDARLRDLVRRTFGTDLLDAYGTTEIGYVASECAKHEGMHNPVRHESCYGVVRA